MFRRLPSISFLGEATWAAAVDGVVATLHVVGCGSVAMARGFVVACFTSVRTVFHQTMRPAVVHLDAIGGDERRGGCGGREG